jgi:hypothetical protein
MNEHAVMLSDSESETDDKSLLKKQSQSSADSGLASIDFKNLVWVRKDIYFIMLSSMMNFGDAVEIYLPGVITQAASKELKVTQSQEGMLGVILYLSLTVSLLFSTAFKSRYNFNL